MPLPTRSISIVTSGKISASSQASSELSTASFNVVKTALVPELNPTCCRFFEKYSAVELLVIFEELIPYQCRPVRCSFDKRVIYVDNSRCHGVQVSCFMGTPNEVSVNEIFKSIQGESSQAGRPCTFVRLRGCPLRCTWCDSEYAFFEGSNQSFDKVLEQVRDLNCSLVEVTGGEPLAQKSCLSFLQFLLDHHYEVMLETSGAFPIENVPKAVRIIMDIKAPGSGEESRNRWENLKSLKEHFDEIKIVIKDRGDFDYAVRVCTENNLLSRYTVLLSAVDGVLTHAQLAEWILDSKLPFRFQLQMHKAVWPHKERAF